MQLVDPDEQQVPDLDQLDGGRPAGSILTLADGDGGVGVEGRLDKDLAVEEVLGQDVDPEDQLDPEDGLDDRPPDGGVGLLAGSPSDQLGRVRLGRLSQAIEGEDGPVDVNE